MKIHTTPNQKNVRIFAENLEASALAQIENIAMLPSIVGDLALMADAHTGKGVPIGTVFATEDLVVPDVISGDIGCGMVLMKTTRRAEELNARSVRHLLQKVNNRVCKNIHHHGSSELTAMLPSVVDRAEPVVAKSAERAARQLGTLGGGNHFIELQRDEEGMLWVMVHSGSRGLGQAVNGYYHDAALALCERLGASYPQGFPYLLVDTDEGRGYLAEQAYCLRYAEANRELLRRACEESLREEIGDFEVSLVVQTHHNFLSKERWDDRDVFVHRKGAVAAPAGAFVTIPGSMETSSFLCRGTGSALSLGSVSHGAGRAKSRGQMTPKVYLKDDNGEVFRDKGGYARVDRPATDEARRVAAKEMILEMEAKGITLVTHDTTGVIDERAHGYKDVTHVINAQRELLEVVTELWPLGVVKAPN
ncbi:MAG: RtcB family protein [Deltaproteobacteria bacterium]|nr:RtcB family protein [Deltaproteobacteria bacterium]